MSIVCSWRPWKNYIRITLGGIVLALFVTATFAADGSKKDEFDIDGKSFQCITKMTKIRQFYVNNLLGKLGQTLAVANSATGGAYPPGSLIQLVPTEAMVKRDKGFNAATHDWEFFDLDISKDGTKIRTSGVQNVVNSFGGNCFGCHALARPQWDMICESNHGCAPLQITPAMIGAVQRADPRCKNGAISPQDAEQLRLLAVLHRK
jgi:hypothetical protein